MQVGDKIRALRQSKTPKMTSTDLAEKADISQSYVIEIESGRKNPSLEVLSRLARALDVSLVEIIGGTATTRIPTRYRYIPVINKVSCGEWMDVGDLDFPPGFGTDYELSDSKDPNSFYVIAEGDSMVGGRIQEGDYLLVSPNMQYNSGDIVLAKSDEGVMVKRYVKRGDQVVLEPLNPHYKPWLLEGKGDLKIYKVAEIKIKL
ncbi:MAG: helix-turn-helix domain-containing protein [Candidatus Hydrogenedentota bacterium]|nr:MAG: helix-turn-helix domain-containing protein [Candidatus Hydrogenedentota bacterium]